MVQKNYTLPPIQGYVTAASTPEGQEYGYIFPTAGSSPKTVLPVPSILADHGATMQNDPDFL